jgi:hypothetical protein
MDPILKKSLIARIGEKCPIDEDVCSDVVSLVESWPECGGVPQRHRRQRTSASPVMVEQTFVQEAPVKRQRRPHKLSEYQKHMSVCLLKEKGFNSCIKLWAKDSSWNHPDSMADQYRGSGMTK